MPFHTRENDYTDNARACDILACISRWAYAQRHNATRMGRGDDALLFTLFLRLGGAATLPLGAYFFNLTFRAFRIST